MYKLLLISAAIMISIIVVINYNQSPKTELSLSTIKAGVFECPQSFSNTEEYVASIGMFIHNYLEDHPTATKDEILNAREKVLIANECTEEAEASKIRSVLDPLTCPEKYNTQEEMRSALNEAFTRYTTLFNQGDEEDFMKYVGAYWKYKSCEILK